MTKEILRFDARKVNQYPGIEFLEDQVNLGILEAVQPVSVHSLGPTVQILEPLGVGFLLPVL